MQDLASRPIGRRSWWRSTPHVCLVLFGAVWIALAIAPWDRGAWVLENAPTVVGVGATVLTFRRFRFSDRAYVQATLFLLLHTIGSHFTYSETPMGDWLSDAMGLGRNHYDRLVHFAFGALMLRATREVFFRPPAAMPRQRELWISVALISAWGCGYELLEWLTASVVDPLAGTAFLGTQGDPWDAQKDLLAAACGSFVGAALEAMPFTKRDGARAA
jgi:putative membrane protein